MKVVMLDTVVLTLVPNQFRIFQSERFSPNPSLFASARGTYKFYNNASKDATEYYPRLTLYQRPGPAGTGTSRTLRIEFSATKLLFGNNFDELFKHEFSKVLETLQIRLREMGVFVTKNDLTTASVSAIHYSKNLVFTDGITSRMLIALISKANSTKRREVNQREYRNDGYAFRWHTTSYEIVYYDKIADLMAAKRTEKGRIEKDNAGQLSLFDGLDSTRPFEVMRVEVRLNTRAKMNALFKVLGIEKQLTFAELFDAELSKQIITHFWNEMATTLPPRSDRQNKVAPQLRNLTNGKGTESVRTAFALIALERLIEQEGITGARAIVSELANDRLWYRLFKQLEQSEAFKDREHLAIQKASALLSDFRPVSLKALDM